MTKHKLHSKKVKTIITIAIIAVVVVSLANYMVKVFQIDTAVTSERILIYMYRRRIESTLFFIGYTYLLLIFIGLFGWISFDDKMITVKKSLFKNHYIWEEINKIEIIGNIKKYKPKYIYLVLEHEFRYPKDRNDKTTVIIEYNKNTYSEIKKHYNGIIENEEQFNLT